MVKLALRGVTKRFGEVVAVNNLSLEVKEGEFLVLVGPSGCGKTTTLRLIAGLEEPDEGEIYIDGELLNRVPPGRRGVQMIFQTYALWPHMKVFDEKGYSNLSFPLKVRQWVQERIKGRVDEISQKLGIEERLRSRKPTQLSAGQQQRIAVGRALVHMPKILLMDEPLANLDPQSRLRVREEVRKNHDEFKLTTVYVTHNLADAVALADRIAIMNEGKLLQVDTPREVYDHPTNAFVADFMRSDLPKLPSR